MPDIVKTAMIEQKTYCERLYGYNVDCFVFGFDRPLPAETIRKNLIRGVESANADGNPLCLIRVHDFRHPYVKLTTKKFATFFENFRATA